jgi:hypothetical protein
MCEEKKYKAVKIQRHDELILSLALAASGKQFLTSLASVTDIVLFVF